MSHYQWKNWTLTITPNTKHEPLCYYCHKAIKDYSCLYSTDGYHAHKQCFEEEG